MPYARDSASSSVVFSAIQHVRATIFVYLKKGPVQSFHAPQSILHGLLCYITPAQANTTMRNTVASFLRKAGAPRPITRSAVVPAEHIRRRMEAPTGESTPGVYPPRRWWNQVSASSHSPHPPPVRSPSHCIAQTTGACADYREAAPYPERHANLPRKQ